MIQGSMTIFFKMENVVRYIAPRRLIGMQTSCTLSQPAPCTILVLGQAVPCYIFTVIDSVNISRVPDTRANPEQLCVNWMYQYWTWHRINILLEIKCQTIKYYT